MSQWSYGVITQWCLALLRLPLGAKTLTHPCCLIWFNQDFSCGVGVKMEFSTGLPWKSHIKMYSTLLFVYFYSAFPSSHYVSFWQPVTSVCLTGIARLSPLSFIFLIFVLLLLGNADVTIAVKLYMLYSLLSHIFWLPTPEGRRLWCIS